MLRGGAGRIIFTPYFLVANILVILFLTVKYWSASNYEFELLNKVHLLEIELKSCKTTSINCGGEFKHKSKNLQTCQEDFQTLQNKYDKLNEDLKLKNLELDTLNKKHEVIKSSAEEDSRKCVENLEECQAAEDKCTQNLKNAENSLIEVRSSLENCSLLNAQETSGDNESRNRTELLESKSIDINGTNISLVDTNPQLPEGELPDVNPDAVVVRSKPVNVSSGMKFHSDADGHPLPLLPHGDPSAPRPGPRFSVIDPPKNLNLTKSSTVKDQNSEQLKVLPKPEEKVVQKSFKDIKNKPKNLDAREAENMDYDGEDQDPNGAIEDTEKVLDRLVSGVNNEVL